MTAFAKARAFRWLVVQSREEHASIRYGACFGLRWHTDNPEALALLRDLEKNDVDNEVRLAAHLVLNGFGT